MNGGADTAGWDQDLTETDHFASQSIPVSLRPASAGGIFKSAL